MKKLKFSMIELLVGMAVLTIMMVFLISAFTTAEQVASSGNREMDAFEKSNMALDFMVGEISQLTVNDAPRTVVPMQYEDDSITFIAQLPFSDEPLRLRKITFSLSGDTLSRTVQLWDDKDVAEDGDPKEWEAATTEVLLTKVEEFKVAVFGEVLGEVKAMPVSTDIVEFPKYCNISLKLENPEAVSEIVQRTFTRRIFYN